MQLTPDQVLLLEKIKQYQPTSRRTDNLARCMRSLYGSRWDLQHTPFIGLELRKLELVTTYKDSEQYARWDITPQGMAVLAEHNNRGKKSKEPPVTLPPLGKVDYLVLPKGKQAQALRFGNEEEALHKAKYLSNISGYDYEVVETRVVATVKYIPAVAAKIEVTKP